MSLPLLHAGRTNPGLSAALDLRFALDKSLTAYRGPTPSFSRASTGTYFDGSGVLRYAPVNLVQYSEQLDNVYWSRIGSTISPDSAIAPDGKMAADKLVETATNSTHRVYRETSGNINGAKYYWSFYAKAAERSWVILDSSDATTNYLTWFNLSNGTVGTVDGARTASIQPVGNGWYRCSVYGNLINGTQAGIQAYTATGNNVSSFLGDASAGIYVWGMQIERSDSLGVYVPTTSSANSAPRFNHTFNGTSWVSRGLLVEEQRTNLVTNSSDFTSTWVDSNVARITSSGTAPDGTNTAVKMYPTSSTTMTRIYRSAAYSCISVFAKAAEKSIVYFYDLTGVNVCWFDLVNGAIGTNNTGLTASMINCSNGWFRCSLASTSSTFSFFQIGVSDANGSLSSTASGTNGILIWGAQGESGAFPTSYIPAITATTRSADVCQITGGDFSGFWNGTEGTIAAEFEHGPASGDSCLYMVAGGSTDPQSTVFITGGNIESSGYNGSSIYALNFGSWSSSTAKICTGFKTNDFAGSLNGGAALTDTSGTLSTAFNRLQIGRIDWGGGAYWNGHIARLRYFNKRLPNATLQLLSEPDPTLNLQFALNKTLTPVAGPAPSFSRASTGSYFNASGVLTSASINTPRFDHVFSGGQWVSKGLLLEEQRTNQLTNSNNFSSAFPTGGAQWSSSAAVSPDGTNNAWKLYESAPGSGSLDQRKYGIYSVSGSNTLSIFVKAAGRTQFLLFTNASPSVGSWFNLSNATCGNLTSWPGATQAIQDCGNGWYRCSITSLISSSAYQLQIMLDGVTDTNPNRVGDGVSGFYVAHAQAEAGLFATSPIATSGSTATRSADVCQITGTSFGWMWNQGEGSFAIECDRISFPSTTSFAFEAYSDTSNKILLENDSSADYSSVRNGGVDVVSWVISPAIQPNVSNKSALAYKANDFAWSRLGATPVTDTSGGVPYCNALAIGNRGAYGALYALNGHIAKLIYYPARLTNTKLQQLST